MPTYLVLPEGIPYEDANFLVEGLRPYCTSVRVSDRGDGILVLQYTLLETESTTSQIPESLSRLLQVYASRRPSEYFSSEFNPPRSVPPPTFADMRRSSTFTVSRSVMDNFHIGVVPLPNFNAPRLPPPNPLPRGMVPINLAYLDDFDPSLFNNLSRVPLGSPPRVYSMSTPVTTDPIYRIRGEEGYLEGAIFSMGGSPSESEGTFSTATPKKPVLQEWAKVGLKVKRKYLDKTTIDTQTDTPNPVTRIKSEYTVGVIHEVDSVNVYLNVEGPYGMEGVSYPIDLFNLVWYPYSEPPTRYSRDWLL